MFRILSIVIFFWLFDLNMLQLALNTSSVDTSIQDSESPSLVTSQALKEGTRLRELEPISEGYSGMLFIA